MSTMPSPERPRAKVQAFTSLRAMVWIPLLLVLASCQPHSRSDSGAANVPHSEHLVEVVEIGAARYEPRGSAPASTTEAASCAAWSLDKRQAERFLALSHVLPEGALHGFSWLPCTIPGRVRWDNREWQVEINAAATSIWRSGDEVRLMGCSDIRCEPFVILMPD